MNKYLRDKIGITILFIGGVLGISYQIYKFMTNQLDRELSEIVITSIFVFFIRDPKNIMNVVNKFVDALISLINKK